MEMNRHSLALLARRPLILAAFFRTNPYVGHGLRVGFLAWNIAREHGLGAKEAARIGTAAALHDIGKAHPKLRSIAGTDMTKEPGKLDYFKKKHVRAGPALLRAHGFSEFYQQVAGMHHERLDRSGYFGKGAKEIPIAARITAVADSFDAMTAGRHYQKALSAEGAVRVLKREAETGKLEAKDVHALERVLQRNPLVRTVFGKAIRPVEEQKKLPFWRRKFAWARA